MQLQILDTRTSARARILAVLALIALITGGALAARSDTSAGADARKTRASRPNIVVIQTDDQNLADTYAKFVNRNGRRAAVMPNVLNRIKKPGVSFGRYYVSYPLCCPSRATLLSGRYSHSNGVISNDAPRGGYPSYQIHTINNHNIGTYLQKAGYRTIHIGKFLNNYGGKDDPAETIVPPGWSDWESLATDNSTRDYYGYLLNVNGEIQGPFGDPEYNQTTGKDDPSCVGLACNYSSDQFTQRAVNQIQTSAPGGPFYLQIDYNAPHGDPHPPIGPEPAPRDYNSAASTPLPRPPNFNEANIRDKPSFLKRGATRLPANTIVRLRTQYQKIIESLRGVDDGVGRIINALSASGELQNTYIFFISDNGIFVGQHRLERGKFLPYEEATHMPLMIRGPGIRPRSTSRELTGNMDIAPTISQLARAPADRSYDGRSMVPFWRNTSRLSRRPVLLESFADATDIEPEGGSAAPAARRSARPAHQRIAAPVENFLSVRLGPYKYTEYETGDRELYDLSRDPYELQNIVRNRRYNGVHAFLKRQLNRLEDCRGRACKFETGRLPQPHRPRRR